MTVTVENVIPAKLAENTQTVQYTSSDGKLIIDKFTVTNVSGATASISINLVASGGAAGPSNLIVDSRALASGETYTTPEVVGHTLRIGDFISTLASASSALVIRCSGRIIS